MPDAHDNGEDLSGSPITCLDGSCVRPFDRDSRAEQQRPPEAQSRSQS